MNPSLTALLTPMLRHARAEATTLPLVPELRLYLLNADYPQQDLSPEEIDRLMNYPAYWCFCWASGQVLARYILDNPEQVRGRRVLDFGCGSGVVAIAAALAGAAQVVACDTDPDALAAARANAHLNGVGLEYCEDLAHWRDRVDVLIVADVLYDRANLALLETFLRHAERVLLADSRIRDFDFPGYKRLDERRATTVPDLAESEEFSRVRLYVGHRQKTAVGGKL